MKPVLQTTGEIFYQKLFVRAPYLRHLFKEDVTAQAGRLGYMLTYIVSRLDKMDTLLHDVQNLAIRHNKYGAQPEHYAIVGECLLATLEEGLGEGWNKKLKEAWTTLYTLLSDAMIQAQQESLAKRA